MEIAESLELDRRTQQISESIVTSIMDEKAENAKKSELLMVITPLTLICRDCYNYLTIGIRGYRRLI